MYNLNDIYRTKEKPANSFTLIELVVVILTVSILAAVAVPLMHTNIENSKWSEANATAGTIRTAISTYIAQHSITEARNTLVGKKLDNSTIQQALGFTSSELTGTYFVPSNYHITDIDAIGHASVKVTASQPNAPEGTKTLDTDGKWK